MKSGRPQGANHLPSLPQLSISFMRLGVTAFGGPAMVAYMRKMAVEHDKWLHERHCSGTGDSGPIVITATFVGYLLYGPLDGLIATVSVFLPSFLIVVGVAPYFARLRASFYFSSAIGGILCFFVGLCLTVTIDFASKIQWDLPRILLTGAAFVALLLKVDLIWTIPVGTAISLSIL